MTSVAGPTVIGAVSAVDANEHERSWTLRAKELLEPPNYVTVLAGPAAGSDAWR